MKLLSVQLKAFRAGNALYNLEGKDIFIGPNGIGKSRIQQAIQLGVTGSVSDPRTETNYEIVELFTKVFGADEMGVVLTFSALVIERTFTISEKQGKVSVSQKILINGLPKSIQEGEKEIVEALGSLPLMFDVHKFIRLSDNSRAEMMLQFSSGEAGYTGQAILTELFPFATDELAEYHKMLSAHLSGDIKKGIENSIAYLKAQESALKKETKNNQSAAIGNATAATTDGTRPLREISEINEDVTKAQADQVSLSVEISKAKGEKDRFQENEAQKKALESKMDALRSEASQQLIDNKTAAIGLLRLSLKTGIEKIQNEADEKRAEQKKVTATHQDALRSEALAKDRFEQLETEIENFTNDKCPTCGQDAKSVVDNLKDRHADAQGEYQRKHDDAEILKGRLDDIELGISALDGEVHAALMENKRIESEIHALELELSGLQSKNARLAEMKTEYDALASKTFDISLNTAEAELQLQALSQRMRTLQAEKDEKLSFDTRIIAAKEAAAKAHRAKESAEWVKQSLAILTDIRWKIVRSSIEPIRKEASRLFALTLDADSKAEFDFQFRDLRGNEVFKFGWKTKGVLGDMFIDFDSLSTSQQVFTIAALLIPMIQRANPKFRFLMMDNVEVIDDSRRFTFSKMLEAAEMDNIVLASSAEWPRMDFVTVHSLGVTEEEVAQLRDNLQFFSSGISSGISAKTPK